MNPQAYEYWKYQQLEPEAVLRGSGRSKRRESSITRAKENGERLREIEQQQKRWAEEHKNGINHLQ